MSNPSDLVSVSTPHYSRSEFYNSLARQCMLEEKKVFNVLKNVVEKDQENFWEVNHGRLEYIEYLTKLTQEYNTLARKMRKISEASFS